MIEFRIVKLKNGFYGVETRSSGLEEGYWQRIVTDINLFRNAKEIFENEIKEQENIFNREINPEKDVDKTLAYASVTMEEGLYENECELETEKRYYIKADEE